MPLCFLLPTSPQEPSPFHRLAWEQHPLILNKPDLTLSTTSTSVNNANEQLQTDELEEWVEKLNGTIKWQYALGPNDSLQLEMPLWYKSRLEHMNLLYPKVDEEDETEDEEDPNELIPCVFTWANGGHHVMLTGTFTNWVDHIPMQRSGQELTVIKELPRGVHLYKFIVDGEWRFCPHQPTKTDGQHNVNNVLDLRSFKKQTFSTPDDNELARRALYTQVVPKSSSYTTDAPLIPIILGKR